MILVNVFGPHLEINSTSKQGAKAKTDRRCDAHYAAMFVLYFQLAANQSASGDAADPSQHVLAHLHHSRGIIYKNKLPLLLSAPGVGGGETERWSGMRCLKKSQTIYLPASLQRHIATPYSRCCITTSINLRYVKGRSLRGGIMALDRGDFLAVLCGFMLKAPWWRSLQMDEAEVPVVSDWLFILLSFTIVCHSV